MMSAIFSIVYRTLLAFLLMLAMPMVDTGALAQSASATPPARLTVGTLRLPPFVMRGDDGKWTGLSVELWEQVAAEMKRDFVFREFDYDQESMLKAIEAKEIDVAVGAFPVSVEGEERGDFSHAYFQAGVGIAVKAQQPSGILATLGSLFTSQLLAPIGVLVTALLCVGALVWIFERKRNAASFSPHPVKGVGDGVWWAAVTMTTTGYGDKTPVTVPGRAVALLWMFASIFGIALFSATLASSFVVGKLKSNINGPADLPGARIGVVTGTSGEAWLNAQGLSARSYPFVIQASRALQRGEIEALVFERAVLGHMIKSYDWKDLHVLPQSVAVRDYGVMMQTDSPLRKEINRAVLKVTQRREWRDVVQKHVGATDF
jgi:polar amino acid transport system substrate-binding protein